MPMVNASTMPALLAPMLAKLARSFPEDAGYAFEIKWDGIRTILFLEGKNVRLQSRNLLDITRHYPELREFGDAIPSQVREAIFDGEIVCFNAQGVPSFECLQKRMHLSTETRVHGRMAGYPICYMLFDILYVNGKNLMNRPYVERRRVLDMLAIQGKHWQTPAYHLGDGPAILEASRRMQLEGIIAKRLDSPYLVGQRSDAWLKIKNKMRQEFIIGGWLPGGGSRLGRIGALLLGYYDISLEDAARAHRPQRLCFAGKAGTGFTEKTLDDLARLFGPRRRDSNPFEVNNIRYKNAVFIEPSPVGEFEFTEWTRHGILRHPSFKGLRMDKDPREVVREVPQE